MDEAGRAVPPDDRQVGEIQVRGPDRHARLLAATRGDPRGLRATGGCAPATSRCVDAEGFVNIVDRKKDMIITGGENVYSTEVENVLYEHPAVLEAAVFGVPDPTWGEAVAAAVVPRPGAALASADLEALCRQRLASFKVPRIWRFLDTLPKTGSGKIAKRRLREGAP